jgi:hypothetical protein
MGRLIRIGALLALILSLSACKNQQQQIIREKPLPDPLLTSKKPIEGKQWGNETVSSTQIELPPPPPMPDDIVPIPTSTQPPGSRPFRRE